MSKTFEEWWHGTNLGIYSTSESIAGSAWHARDAEIDLLQSELNLADALLASMQAKIEEGGAVMSDLGSYEKMTEAEKRDFFRKREFVKTECTGPFSDARDCPVHKNDVVHDTELRAQIFAEGWVPVNQVADKVNQARLEEAEWWSKWASPERTREQMSNRLADLRAAVRDSDPRK